MAGPMFGQQQLKGRVTVTDVTTKKVWTVEISTIDSPMHFGGPPETCIFWADPRGSRRGSTVVETYADWNEAQAGHTKWTQSPRAVAEQMVEAGWQG